ncbi:O-antigen/teichoic acid export membrane protein [Kribbella steppae]|uniref:O-antigen/teichoic acid export membrane protein n=1 Tax=Kribbella steppae TaxID=2512223 RepID=A0A4R2HVE3_9ACTN|nr:O-antigen/teichoic acid export membrane protein [Kribbella steppae]
MRGVLRRVTWGLADQAVTSLVSFVVGIVVARSLGAVEFGAFSLAWVTYGVVVNISRGLATDPLAVRFSGVPRPLWKTAVASSSGMAMAVGLATGAICVAVGAALGGRPGAAFIALGLVLPGLMLQDSWRFAFFASGQGGKAFVSDITWALGLVPLLYLAKHDGPSVTKFVLAWGAAGIFAALVSGLQAGVFPRLFRARQWFRDHRDLGLRYLAENVTISGAYQLKMYGLGAIAGVAAVGTVRGAEMMLGPFFIVLSGIGLVAVPEAARMLRRSVRALQRFCLLLGSAQSLAALAWGMTIIIALPHAWGHALLGEVWDSTEPLLLPATLSVMFASFYTGAAAGLRALGVARRSLRAQLYASAAYLVGGVGGAALGGALGSAWGSAGATLVGAIVWWWSLEVGIRERRHETEPEPVGAAGREEMPEMRST